MNRRELFKRVVSAAAVPAASFGQQHAHEFPDFAQLSAPAADPNWKPAFFDEHQNATVVTMSELIIPETDTPGAKAALVNRYMDRILHEQTPEVQRRITDGLAHLDQLAKTENGKAFVDCAPAQQTKILEALEAKRDPFFGYMKGFTVRIYYSTKPGFLELNKGGRVPDTFACQDAEHKASKTADQKLR